MIVGNRKSLEKIRQMVKPYKKILLLGCRECITVCAAGGEREVAVLASELNMSRAKDGQEIDIKEFTLERQCDFEVWIRSSRLWTDMRRSFPWRAGRESSIRPNGFRKDRSSRDQHHFSRRDAGAGIVERTVPGLRRVHPASDRGSVPGGALREEPFQRSLRRIRERQVRSEQGHQLRLAADHRPAERTGPTGPLSRK